jgi:hypothetical protein
MPVSGAQSDVVGHARSVFGRAVRAAPFVDNPLIPIDNSASEREFQNVAKLRLNMLFAGGTEGAHRAATLLGVTGTCRAIDVNPQAYLTWVFDRLGTHRDIFNLLVEALTPAAFKALRLSNTS